MQTELSLKVRRIQFEDPARETRPSAYSRYAADYQNPRRSSILGHGDFFLTPSLFFGGLRQDFRDGDRRDVLEVDGRKG